MTVVLNACCAHSSVSRGGVTWSEHAFTETQRKPRRWSAGFWLGARLASARVLILLQAIQPERMYMNSRIPAGDTSRPHAASGSLIALLRSTRTASAGTSDRRRSRTRSNHRALAGVPHRTVHRHTRRCTDRLASAPAWRSHRVGNGWWSYVS
jgi:hypothetical protein